MQTAQIRRQLYDYIFSAEDKKVKAIYTLLENEIMENQLIDKNIVNLTEEQILMLQLSDKDIENGKLISQMELDQIDLEWLKEK